MGNKELDNNVIKLEIMLSDLKTIVMGQCATILNLVDENREIKRLLEKRTINDDVDNEYKDVYCLMTALENMHNHECKFFDIKEER